MLLQAHENAQDMSNTASQNIDPFKAIPSHLNNLKQSINRMGTQRTSATFSVTSKPFLKDKANSGFGQFSTISQLMMASAGQMQMQNKFVDPKKNKKITFTSRNEMIKYIENFRAYYKTELCKNWMEEGQCEFGDDCVYAHGRNELNKRNANPHKNYKTKMCKQWHESTPGVCTYGVKCQFIHEE